MKEIPTQMIPIGQIEPNKGQIKGLPKNPRLIRDEHFKKLLQSIKDNPEMLYLRELLVYPHEGKYITIGGNMRLMAMRDLGYTEAPCKVIPNTLIGDTDDESEEIKRMEDEFKRRMEAGEDLSEDEEYQAFLEKFKMKKTTDDCYTPKLVYDAVVEWVEKEYQVSRKTFVRPFYPNGDYQKEKYPKGCIVVDNPPFSILAEILQFYKEKGVRFFLFAPSLTLFSSSSSSSSTALCVGVSITYENGANVSTSFLTNLENRETRFRSAPTLFKAVEKANDEWSKSLHKELPKYTYPDNVVTSAFVARLSKYGIDFAVNVNQSCAISSLESQKESGKAIFGKGYLISEKAAAEKAAATRWKLSDKEHKIIEQLSKYDEP